jgi:hypothetical protein
MKQCAFAEDIRRHLEDRVEGHIVFGLSRETEKKKKRNQQQDASNECSHDGIPE